MFEEIFQHIPTIQENTNYWMVRTSAGKYYKHFLNNNKIAMGGDYISPDDILKLSHDKNEFIEKISPIITRHTDTERPGLTANQFYRFYHEIKKDDFVLIPSESSTVIAIGKIVDDTPLIHKFDNEDNIECNHIHTRSVEWITTKFRSDFNPKFTPLLFSHNAIVDANDYREHINGVVYDFYATEHACHYLINIKTTDDINANALLNLYSELFYLTAEFFGEQCSDDIKIKISLCSPGFIELISLNKNKLIFIGMVLITLTGGKLNCAGFIEINSNGLIKTVLEFLEKNEERKHRMEILKNAQINLNIDEPKELAKIIKKH